MMRVSADELLGRTILAADGHVIGELTVVLLDSESWRVEAIRARLRKDVADQLGAERGLFHAGAIEIPVSMVQSIGDAVILAVTGAELRKTVAGDQARERETAAPR